MPITPILRPTRRRTLVAGGVAVLLLTAMAADRVAAHQAEHRTARAFRSATGTAELPDVDVRGFPVLPQLARGTIDTVDVSAHDIPADSVNRPLPITRLDVRLRGLSAPEDGGEATSRTARATAFLSYGDLSRSLGFPITQGREPGSVQADLELPFGGAPLTLVATPKPGPGNSITFADAHLVGGDHPAAADALLERAFRDAIPLKNVPGDLHLRGLDVTSTGLSAGFTGQDVTFRRA